MDPLVVEVFKATYTEQFLKPFLQHLKDAGYKKVWIGVSNPHWKTGFDSDMIVAEPSVRTKKKLYLGEPELWKIYKEFTEDMKCGNGLGAADQLQGAGWLCMFKGEYDLTC